MVPARRQAIIWTNGVLVSRCIYVSLGLNELSAVVKETKNLTILIVWSMHRYLPEPDYWNKGLF